MPETVPDPVSRLGKVRQSNGNLRNARGLNFGNMVSSDGPEVMLAHFDARASEFHTWADCCLSGLVVWIGKVDTRASCQSAAA